MNIICQPFSELRSLTFWWCKDIFITNVSIIPYFQIGTFLYRKLGRAGLVLYLQTFHYTSTSGTSEAGVNIVGVLPGARWIGCRIQNIYLSTIYVYIYYICNAALARWGTADDRPLVVATYWDVQVTPQNIFAQKEQSNGQGRIIVT